MNQPSKALLIAVVLSAMAVSPVLLLGEAPPPDLPPPAPAEPAAAPPPAEPPAAGPAEPANVFTAEQLEQMVAPVALYPDSLLMQILMAATYPLEVVEAERWVKKNPNLKGEELDKATADKGWDPSVSSLTHFPDVLTRMSDNLDWTKDIGDAFLAQQKDILDAIQRMRQKAYELGNLKSTPEQTVTVEPAPKPQGETVVVEQAPPQIIKIEPAQPQVVYVPTYSSTVVYGPPPPAMYYPTMYAYPPGYVATASLLSFGAGMAVGAALWGDCDWGHHEVDVNYNTNVNRNVNRGDVNRGNRGQRPQQWKHNPEHRRGVGYRNDATAKRYGQASDRGRRDSARGYQRPSGAQPRQPSARTTRGGQPSVANRAGPSRPAGGGRPAAATRPAPAPQNRPASRNTAFGMESGRAERAASARGASSRGVDRGSFARDTGGRGGGGFGGRGGGGGGRGGGGFRGGGGGRGRR